MFCEEETLGRAPVIHSFCAQNEGATCQGDTILIGIHGRVALSEMLEQAPQQESIDFIAQIATRSLRQSESDMNKPLP